MPTVEDIGPYKLFFYSDEGNEAPHVHVRRENAVAKFWMDPLRLAGSKGFGSHELRTIQRIVADNRKRILEAWHEHFGD